MCFLLLCDVSGLCVPAVVRFFLQVQAGAGRTGKWWGHQHFDQDAMKPDMVIFAKGIASGYPIAGTAVLYIVGHHPLCTSDGIVGDEFVCYHRHRPADGTVHC